MKKLFIVSLLLLSACGTPEVETYENVTCNPPKQTKDVQQHTGVFTSLSDYEEAKAFKQRDFENCIQGLKLIREFQAEDLKYQQLKRSVQNKRR
jgi:hypothetical protein